MTESIFNKYLQEFGSAISSIIEYDKGKDSLLLLDFTAKNNALTEDVLNNTEAFCNYIETQLQQSNSRYGIGGYDELRNVYTRSNVFDGSSADEEPRRLHLGIDIWGAAGTIVYAPIAGTVHSTAFNDAYGDYGATIILEHPISNGTFYSLYGHLSLADIKDLKAGDVISAGMEFAHFGLPHENGHWPPHLHFQIIIDMEGKMGDYPGVCKLSEREKYLHNCPNPDLLLRLMQYGRSAR